MLYKELCVLALSMMFHSPAGQTLQPTALVHEAYLRLEGEINSGWNSRGHFFGAAAQVMRNILVDQARRKAAAKHGSHLHRASIEPDDLPINTGNLDILALEVSEATVERYWRTARAFLYARLTAIGALDQVGR